MNRAPHPRGHGEAGFTLLELLVVILIIGILAAIAIPSFLSQKNKATDAAAKETARTAAQAAETYATDHGGGDYTGIEPSVLHEYEPALQVGAGNNNAYLSEAKAIESGKGFAVVSVSAPTGDKFTWTHRQNGEVQRTCKAETSNESGCRSGSW